MSTQAPGPGRRRRIAGERRGSTGAATASPGPASSTGTSAPADPRPAPPSPTDPTRGPDDDRGPARTPLSARLRPGRPTERPRTRGRRPGLTAGLAALLVLLLAYSGLLLLGWLGNDGLEDVSQAEDEAAAARTAQASAERAADAVLAYDYRSLDSDRDAATRFMTEDYAADYVGTFDTAVKEAATDAKAQVAVEVQAAAVVSASTDEAKVLLFVDQTTLSSASDQPRQALNRVEFQMVRQGDSWLVDDILSF